ncbi:hypothetical protein ACLOJK_010903 [Asimina triloba]
MDHKPPGGRLIWSSPCFGDKIPRIKWHRRMLIELEIIHSCKTLDLMRCTRSHSDQKGDRWALPKVDAITYMKEPPKWKLTTEQRMDDWLQDACINGGSRKWLAMMEAAESYNKVTLRCPADPDNRR